MLEWIEIAAKAITAAELTQKVTEDSDQIREFFRRIINRILHGELVLPIFGSGGAGKSTLSRLLAGDDPLSLATPFEESWRTEIVKIPGDIPGRFLVAPGQQARVETFWPEIIHAANSKKGIGLINVVSYGLHSFGALSTYRSHEFYREGMTKDDFVSSYMEHRRRLEIEQLNHLVERLSPIRKEFWLLTIVTKQDLWWANRDNVKSHYVSGGYGTAIEKLSKHIGGGRFHHEFVPTSLAMENFYDPAGELLVPTSAGYDQSTHIRYMAQVFDRIKRQLESSSHA